MTDRVSTVAVPVLPTADLVRAIAWYERLGFAVRATFEGYAILAIDDAELHLNELEPTLPATESTSGAYLRVADADAVFAHWTAMGAPTIAPPEDQPYGIREFATEDLDGNLWRVGSPLGGAHAFDGSEAEPEPFHEAPAVASTLPTAEAMAETIPEAIPDGQVRTDGGPGTDDDAWFALVSGDERCVGCDFLPPELPARALGAQVRDEVHAFGELLAAADDDLIRRHPSATAWSALEYGVHVRDLLTVFAERVIRTLAEHRPELGWWDHEAAIADGMANESDVSAVVDDMGRNAAKLSEALRMVTEDDWDRSATRRPTEVFTIELMARFALHEVVHHRDDAVRTLASVS